MTVIVAGTFVCTFLVVGAIAYVFLSRRGGHAKGVPKPRGEEAKPSADDVRQTLRDGGVLAHRFVEWFRAGPPERDGSQAPAMRGPVTIWTVAAAVVILGVAVIIFLGVIDVALKVSRYTLEPVLDRVVGRAIPLLFIPGVLPALAAAVVAIGLPLSHKFRPQGRFIMGLCVLAAGLISVWQVPRLISRLIARQAQIEHEGLLFIMGLIASVFLVVSGLGSMGSCEWVRQEKGGDDEEILR